MTIAYRDHLKQLSYSSSKSLSVLMFKRGFESGVIILKWHEIVGGEISKYCTPSKVIKRGPSEQILELYTTSREFLVNYQFYKDEILQKIDKYFGMKSVYSGLSCKIVEKQT